MTKPRLDTWIQFGILCAMMLGLVGTLAVSLDSRYAKATDIAPINENVQELRAGFKEMKGEVDVLYYRQVPVREQSPLKRHEELPKQ